MRARPSAMALAASNSRWQVRGRRQVLAPLVVHTHGLSAWPPQLTNAGGDHLTRHWMNDEASLSFGSGGFTQNMASMGIRVTLLSLPFPL